MSFGRLPIIAALGGLLWQQSAAPPAAQRQAPTFKSGTQVVQVDVRVFDKDGRFVTNLGPGDFEIKEDKVAQPIVSLTLVGGAATAGVAAASGTTAATAGPAATTPAASTRATWLFVFDTPHLSAAGLHRTREALETFISSKFRQGDIGGVVAGGKMANNRLTSDQTELEKAVEDVKLPGNERSLRREMREWPRLQDEYEAWRIGVRGDADALAQATTRACSERPDECYKRDVPIDLQIKEKAQDVARTATTATQLTLSVVRVLSHGLARIPGPKTVVFISEGFFLQDMESELQDATGEANRAGAHFYTIDARGLNKGSASSAIDQATAFDAAGPSVNFDLQTDGTNALAVDTGGLAIRNENNFGRALDTIQQDAGTYYVLGYTPANQSFDGKYRTISVSVTRPGLKVRARRGYLALQPALMLRPTPIAATSPSRGAPGPPGSSASPGPVNARPEPSAGSDVSEPAIPVAAGAPDLATVRPAPPAPAEPPSKALRAKIESGGFVEKLQGEETGTTGVENDAAAKGWAAYQRGDVVDAEAYLGRAAQSPDAHPWVSYALGLAHLALEHYAEAVRAWNHVRAAVPEFEPIYFNLADGYLLQHQDGAALDVLREAGKRWPKDAELLNAIGVVEVRRGALDAAVKSFARAIAAEPADGLGYFNAGRAYQMRAAKSQRFDAKMEKWIGGEEDRKKAREHYEHYLRIGGPFVQQAKDALATLNWEG
ncbi:MAG TPA: VWA domain-containing protein [Vicinamibacterales bacterium]|nr:VWA domain-containing protein [Vicinamibacterales bacterium]